MVDSTRPPPWRRQALLLLLGTVLSLRALAAVQVEELLDSAQAALRTNPDATQRDAQRALDLLVRKPDVDQQVRAHLLLCDYYAERDVQRAGEQLEAASQLVPQLRARGLEAGVLLCNGSLQEARGQSSQAMSLYDQAVEVAAANNEQRLLGDALFSRGYLLGLSGSYASALTDLRRSQQIFEKLQLQPYVLTVLNGIAIQYNRMGDYEQARDIYQRTLEAQRTAGMKREMAATYYNLGRAQENLQQWDAARRSYNDGLDAAHQLGYARGEAYALRGLAAIANETGDPNGALRYAQRADEQQKSAPDERLRAQILLEHGRALHRLGRRPEAISALASALEVLRNAEAKTDIAAALGELGRLQAEQGAWRPAYDYVVEAQQVSDRLLKNQLDQRFALLKVEFDSVAKDRENALLRAENQAGTAALEAARRARQLQGIITGLSAALLLALIFLVLHLRRNARRMGRLAMTDELTGVANRRAVLTQLEMLLQDHGQQTATIILDIDHFKRINDRYGHHAGDAALRAVARLLRSLVSEPAGVGRLGGEEFVIVLPDCGLVAAQDFAETLRAHVQSLDPALWFSTERITGSFGVTVTLPEDSPGQMLRRADAALYTAKRAGRNCVRALATAPLEPAVSGADGQARGAEDGDPGGATRIALVP